MDQIDKKIIELIEQGKRTPDIISALGVTEHKVRTVRKNNMAAPVGSIKEICIRIANNLSKQGFKSELVSAQDSLHQIVVNGMKIVVKTAVPYKADRYRFKMSRINNSRKLRDGEALVTDKIVGIDYSKVSDYVIFVGKDEKSKNNIDYHYWMIPSNELPVYCQNFSLSLGSDKHKQYYVTL